MFNKMIMESDIMNFCDTFLDVWILQKLEVLSQMLLVILWTSQREDILISTQE